MFFDLVQLSSTQGSALSILMYLIASYNYKVNKILVGERPYPDEIVPHIGAAYKQIPDSHHTHLLSTVETGSAYYIKYFSNSCPKIQGQRLSLDV
jgi:hypothetical protein